MLTRITVLLCLFTLVLPARAGIERFVNDQTIIAGEADLNKVDPAELEQWVIEVFNGAGLPDADPSRVQLKESMGNLKQWFIDAKAQGATVAYLLNTTEMMKGGVGALIIPVPDANAKAVAALFHAEATTAPADPNVAAHFRRYLPRAEALPGVGTVWGVSNAIEYVKTITPKERPELSAAFKAAGDAPVKLAIIPTDELRALGANSWLRSVLDTSIWALVAAAPPPKPGIRLIVQAKDANSADQIRQSAIGLLNTGVAASGIEQSLATLLTPTVQNDQVQISLDEKQVPVAAGAALKAVFRARENAMRTMAMSNMRQILQGCLLYSNDHKGNWPDELKELEKYFGGPEGMKRILTNPAKPEVQPAFVYIKPNGQPGANTVVLYESHTDFGAGVNVGFGDGHVEIIPNKKRFEDLLAGQGGM